MSVGAGYWSVVVRPARQMEQVMLDRKEELIMAKQIRQGTAVIKSRKSLRVGSFMISRKFETSLRSKDSECRFYCFHQYKWKIYVEKQFHKNSELK